MTPCLQCINEVCGVDFVVTDGQTDRHTDTQTEQLPYLSHMRQGLINAVGQLSSCLSFYWVDDTMI